MTAFVIETASVIIPPKAKSRVKQPKFRWSEDTVDRLEVVSNDADRSMNETGEILMRWALQEVEREKKMLAGVPEPLKRKKQ